MEQELQKELLNVPMQSYCAYHTSFVEDCIKCQRDMKILEIYNKTVEICSAFYLSKISSILKEKREAIEKLPTLLDTMVKKDDIIRIIESK